MQCGHISSYGSTNVTHEGSVRLTELSACAAVVVCGASFWLTALPWRTRTIERTGRRLSIQLTYELRVWFHFQTQLRPGWWHTVISCLSAHLTDIPAEVWSTWPPTTWTIPQTGIPIEAAD